MRPLLFHRNAWLLGLALLASCAKETSGPVAPAPKSSVTADTKMPQQPSCPNGDCSGGDNWVIPLDPVTVIGPPYLHLAFRALGRRVPEPMATAGPVEEHRLVVGEAARLAEQ